MKTYLFLISIILLIGMVSSAPVVKLGQSDKYLNVYNAYSGSSPETDPFWTSAYALYNDSWSSTTNTSYGLATEPLWTNNYTAYNSSWSSTTNTSYVTYNSTGDIIPITTNISSLGSSLLRWMKGWFWDLNVSNNLDVGGNLVLTGNFSAKRPYGMFSSTEDQTLVSANTAYPVTFNWTEDNYLITKEGNSNFTVSQNGDYLVEISVIVQSALANKNVHIFPQIYSSGVWTNVPRSNTETAIRTASSDYVIAVPFILDIHTNEKFRLMWGADHNGVFLNYKTNTSWSPETPSIIMTVSKISETT